MDNSRGTTLISDDRSLDQVREAPMSTSDTRTPITGGDAGQAY